MLSNQMDGGMVEFLKRGVGDAVSQAGGSAGLALAVVGPVAGIAVQVGREGTGAVSASLPSLLYGFAGFSVAFTGLLLLNILAAPYRNERDKRVALETEVSELKAKISIGPKWSGRVSNMWFGGTSSLMSPDQTNVVLTASVTNIGERASSIPSWYIRIEADNDIRIFKLAHPQNMGLTLGVPQLGDITFAEDDAIYLKTLNPILAGSYVEGWAMAIIPREYLDKFKPGTRFNLCGKDAFGQDMEFTQVMSGIPKKEMPFFAGMKRDKANG